MSATATTAEPTVENIAPAIPMINVQVDGEWKQFPKGTRLIEACMKSGSYVPHYCYHPALSSPGNCRMCLIEMGTPKMGPDRKPELGEDGRPLINWSPKPAICCAIEVSEGLGVRTNSPLVEECRKGVMEFLLINHPLDCPICDKAGECRLQEFSVEYGNDSSRFEDNKVKKPKHVDIGERIVLDDERCILCSRCIRFMDEVAKDDCLGFVDRGGHTTLTVHPGKRLDSNYSLNTVDICPVGALTSKDFRFKMRVWFLKETKTIDTNCGTGSNILIGSRENKVHRITPRENEAVNAFWLPDSHRLNYTYIHREDRLKEPLVSGGSVRWKEAITSAVESLKGQSGAATAMIASGRMTNEELFLASRLAKTLGTELIDIRARAQKGDGFLVSDDGNPNTRGAQLLGVTGSAPGSRLPEIAAGISSGKITSLVVLGENPLHCGLSGIELSKLSSLVTLDILPNDSLKLSKVVLPGSASAEKRGSMVNINGRLQRLNRALTAPGHARDDWEILSDLLQGLGAEGASSLEELFKQMATATPALSGLNFGKIGDLGVNLKA
ncbi:MAG: molybdopterin-dependent oxidoreductase [Chthoniobacterales bacterium]|nr:molybdopterin-dependent oxidoreductase [Chthoniobacterales bacterium]